MDVSVVICTYALDRYDACREAVESVLSQTYEDIELILVVDGNEDVYSRVKDDFSGDPRIIVHNNEHNVGNLQSINHGVERASGDIVANLDDDATAAVDWIERLVDAYRQHDALAAGGRIEPDWVDGEAEYIPEEFYWLVGATHRGFREDPGEVRNTFGSNLSFKREILEELGGYPTEESGRTTRYQAGETELCARLYREYGRGVYYQPEAVVYHKVFGYRTNVPWLHRRAFWQGVSKRWMEVTHPGATSSDRDHVRRLVTEFIPGRLRSVVLQPSKVAVAQLLFLLLLLGTTSLGYGYGVATRVGKRQ